MDAKLAVLEKYCGMKNDRKIIVCSDAFKAAKELDISVEEIGQLCNENRIKVLSCQLGCF